MEWYPWGYMLKSYLCFADCIGHSWPSQWLILDLDHWSAKLLYKIEYACGCIVWIFITCSEWVMSMSQLMGDVCLALFFKFRPLRIWDFSTWLTFYMLIELIWLVTVCDFICAYELVFSCICAFLVIVLVKSVWP